MPTEKQIAANKRNAQKSTGPRTQQGKARSRMNALRHGLSSVVVDASVADDVVLSSDDGKSICAVHDRLRRIYSERVKMFSMIDEQLKHPGSGELNTAIQRLAALERYSRRSYSELKKYTRARTGRDSEHEAPFAPTNPLSSQSGSSPQTLTKRTRT